MPSGDLPFLRSVQRDAASAQEKQAALRATLANVNSEIATLETRALDLDARGDRARAEEARRQLEKMEKRRRFHVEEITGGEVNLRDILDRLRDRIDPCDADPTVPLALLPVRLETRYTADRAAVRIRIFPDDIHVDQLDRGLSEDEVAAGRAYWSAASAGEEAAAAAWVTLANAVHDERAPWVAFALTPTNFEAWQDGAAPEFGELDPRSRRAAVARLLPDRFVAVAEQGGAQSTATGAVIAPEVVVGILAGDGSKFADVNNVKALPGGEWMFDYEQARTSGLAITLPLRQPGARIDRLYVVGVRSSLAPAAGAQAFEDLLHAHRFARGLAIVPQGTPSNNTEKNRSAWQSRLAPTRLPFPNAAAPAPGSNAQILATAFGIDAATWQGVEHADEREQPLARAMNAALWSPTWGTFLDRATQADGVGPKLQIPDAGRAAARDFFRDTVRGRGPLPALRVGNQPYGILPVSTLDEARWKNDARDSLQTGLLPILRRLRSLWLGAANQLPHLSGSATADQTFLDIMGTTPTAAGVRVRTVVSEEIKHASQAGGFFEFITAQAEETMQNLIFAVAGLDPRAFRSLGSLESDSHPLPFPMVHESDPAFITRLLQGTPPAVQSILQALLELSWAAAKKEIDWAMAEIPVFDTVSLASTVPVAQREQAIALSMRVETASAAEFHVLADTIAGAVGETGTTRLRQFAPLVANAPSLAEMAASATVAASRAELAGASLSMWARMNARRAEVRAALQLLATTELEERRILFGETLDLTSHRLDAWLTGFVERRRVTLRAAHPAGLMIGAFGWVENLAPGRRGQSDGGYIHAPTLDHAKTAGVLRSAHLSHNRDANPTGAFAIDLSSARVRTALQLADGMRQGQPLGAVLGYRLERRLHEARLDRFILTLRGLAPLVGGKLTDRHDPVSIEAQESIAANNVVDGVRLIDLYQKGGAARQSIEQALRAPPKSNPYLQPNEWPVFNDATWAGIWAQVEAIIREAATDCDATADLLLAESVHQIIRGNTARAAAALNAASNGDNAAPEAEIVRTPVPGVPFTHRLLLVAPPPGPAWNAARPRALAEPALEAWAAALLGAPEESVVAGELTLAQTGLCALDVIYEAGDARRLEQRVREALPQLPIETELDPAFADTRELAAAWRTVLVSARPARPDDLSRPNDSTLRTVPAAALAAVRARAESARGGLAARTAALTAALAPGEGMAMDPAAVAIAVQELAAYGVVPPMIEREDFRALGEVATAEARRRLELAEKALTGDFDLAAAEAVSQALFGDGFWMVPAIDPPEESDLLNAAVATPSVEPARAEVRRFLRDVGSVRESVSRLSEALLLGDVLDRPTKLQVAQLCPEVFPWVGGSWDSSQPTPRQPVTNLVCAVPNEFDPTQPLVALALDQWSDSVPLRSPYGDEEGALPAERRTTGLALNAAGASAAAPQAILLAVSPDGQRWTTDALVALLRETFDLAKMRGVTFERTFAIARALPALYAQSRSLQKEKSFALSYLLEHADYRATLAFIKEKP